MELGLRDKVAVVSGASQGIGAAIASELANEGCKLALCARREPELRDYAEKLKTDTGVEVFAVSADVTDPSSVNRLRDRVLEHFGGVDFVVNNAGRSFPGNFAKLTDQDFIDDYTVKGLSHIRMCRAFLPSLTDRGGGRIVNINSIHGKHPDPRFFTSSTNRAASMAFSRTLALSLARDNILVNSVNIGYVLTPQWANVHQRSRPDMQREEFFAHMGEQDVPMGRMGTPEEVAGAVAFLLSSRASYITGASLDIGGGMG